MKFLKVSLLLSLARSGWAQPDPLSPIDTVGIKVTKVGSVPVKDENTHPFSYNMNVAEDLENNRLFFLDQKEAIIYAYSPLNAESGNVEKIWELGIDSAPDGLDLSYEFPFSAGTWRVHQVIPSKEEDEIIVVFGSLTLPTGWTKPSASLPAPGAYPGYVSVGKDFVEDYYRIGNLPADVEIYGGWVRSYSMYDVFYKFNLKNNVLSYPRPFFALENQMIPGHQGGGTATLKDGTILYSVGDCLLFGHDGLYAPQDDLESCGKILRIDPTELDSYEVVAKGVRNSQHMKIHIEDGGESLSKKKGKRGGKKKSGKADWGNLVFADIGGVTAEEVNAVSVADLLDTEHIENFGWGRNTRDGKAREGTFYISTGIGGKLGDQPPYQGDAPVPEPGYIQPWIQFGRSENDFFYGIASFCLSETSLDELKIIWTEFNTGLILGSFDDYNLEDYTGPANGYKIKLYDEDMMYLENGLNDLVDKELGGGASRGDPRMFNYPDGTAGVFIERTGVFYRLEEISL